MRKNSIICIGTILILLATYHQSSLASQADRIRPDTSAETVQVLKKAAPKKLDTIAADEDSEEIKEIEVKSANFIKLKRKAKEVFIPDPEVIDVQLLSDNSLYLIGLTPGSSSLVINDKNGKALVDCKVVVTYPLKSMKDAIKEMHPDTKVDVISVDKSIILRGKVPSPEIAQDVVDIAGKFVETTNIINKLEIGTATQVMLKVKIAEVTRNVSKSLGINWRTVSNPRSGEGGMAYGMAFGNTSGFFKPEVNGNGYETGQALLDPDDGLLSVEKGGRWLAYSNGHNPLTALIDALAAESFASVLAEPTLVALSGTTATFKAGGELGYRVQQDGSDTYTTEFKDWGTEIEFTPTVLSEDRINITVKPKVSTVSLGSTGQPEVASKEASTTVELGSGQSLAIAGLLQTSKNSTSSETPFLSDLPLIGSLFRNSTVSNDQKELVVVVTPYIVKPSSKQLKVPTDMVPRMYSPLESILARRFHVKYKKDKPHNAGFSIR